MKNKKIFLSMIIVLGLIFIGFGSYEFYEILSNDKEENKDEIVLLGKDKIKILVYQINIRQEANELSEDIGDVLLNEFYEILEIVDTPSYTWYKINKNGIIGYVANQKGQNWIEYISNQEDSNQTILSEFDNVFFKADYVYSWFTEYTNIQLIESNDSCSFVNIDGLNTKEDLEKLLKSLFSEEIVDKLLNTRTGDINSLYDKNNSSLLFDERNGRLCRNRHIVNNQYNAGNVIKTIKIEQVSESKYVYHVIFSSDYNNLLCNVEKQYVFEKNKDGNFVFTNFEDSVNVCQKSQTLHLQINDRKYEVPKLRIIPYEFTTSFNKYNVLSNEFNVYDATNSERLILTHQFTDLNLLDKIKSDYQYYYVIPVQEYRERYEFLFGINAEKLEIENFEVPSIASNISFQYKESIKDENTGKEYKDVFIFNGGGGAVLDTFSIQQEFYKANILNENFIEVYFYTYLTPRLSSFYSHCQIFDLNNKSIYEDVNSVYDSSKDSLNNLCYNNKDDIEKLKKEGKIPVYKFTYEKKSDGNYYFIKGEWQK